MHKSNPKDTNGAGGLERAQTASRAVLRRGAACFCAKSRCAGNAASRVSARRCASCFWIRCGRRRNFVSEKKNFLQRLRRSALRRRRLRARGRSSRAVAVLDGDFADARALRRDLRADGFRVEKQLDVSGDVEQLVVVGGCSPRWRQKNVSPLMLTDFREGGAADFVSEADFRAAETEILRRRLSAAQDELVRLRAPQGV